MLGELARGGSWKRRRSAKLPIDRGRLVAACSRGRRRGADTARLIKPHVGETDALAEEARRESTDSKENRRRSATTNHYAVMGIHDFARGSEAKRAYHRLALEWHPDRQVHAPEDRQKEAEDVFKRINEAYAILSDSARRKEFDLILRNELLGMASGDTDKTAGANKDASKNSGDAHGPKGNISGAGGGTRQIMCPECGVGAEAKAGKKGGPSVQCQGCSAFFHEVYCAGCKDWGATKGRRGESTMRCGCGNVFCQSRCPSCWRWNTFNGEAQGGRTRTCGFCGCKFHEAYCPGCSSWGVWEGKKGCRSLSCDCGGLFYEISCQSCGMWGSVKGRHADDNNSLRCGTCGSESHEAFCPTCRQWDSYPGSKGESTLTCKSPRCRSRQEGVTTKFFQVYCETCICWRSVLGEKDAVGRASIRCEGCKTNLRGTTCPACGNWDQLLRRQHQQQPQHQGFRRKSRLYEKQPPQPDGSDVSAADTREEEGGNLFLVRPRPICTSCGHQPPDSDGDDEAPEEAFPNRNISLTGVVHEGAEVAAPVTSASAGPTATPAAAAATPLAPAPIHGMNTNPRPDSHDDVGSSRRERLPGDDSPAENLASNDTVVKASNRCGKRQAGSSGTSRDARNTIPTNGAVEGRGGEQPGFQSLPERGVPPSGRADGEVPLPAAPVPSEGTAGSRTTVKPPPRSALRRRGGRRPFVPRHPSVVPSPAEGTEGAEAELWGVKTRTTPEMGTTKEGGTAGGEDEQATAAVFLAPSTAGGPDAPSTTLADNNGTSAGSRVRTDSGRPASRHRGAGRRRRQKRLGSRSSSSSPSPQSLSSKPAATPPAGSPLGENQISVSDDHPPAPAPNAAGDDGGAAAVAAARVTFAAVPRESSPPPPPGMRISGKDGEGKGESGGPGRRTGEKEMVHLAFCSRCEEYQSWRAPLTRTSGRRVWKETASGGGGARRNCTECGDLYANVSYYPAR